MTMGLTPKQSEALAFIEKCAREGKESPTVGEIAAALNLRSKSGALRLLDSLQERGFIKRKPHRARSVRLVNPACPHCGNPIGGEACLADAARMRRFAQPAEEMRGVA